MTKSRNRFLITSFLLLIGKRTTEFSSLGTVNFFMEVGWGAGVIWKSVICKL